MPSPDAARKFVCAFHDQDRIEQAQRELPAWQVSHVPRQSEPVRALARVNQELVREVGRRSAEQKIAAVGVDATLVESSKQEAKPTVLGRV